MVLTVSFGAQRYKVKLPSTASLHKVCQEACKKFRVDPSQYQLVDRKKVLDPTLSIRLSGLNANAVVTLEKAKTKNAGKAEVSVTLEIEGGSSRQTVKVTLATSLWDVLRAVESAPTYDGKSLTERKEVPPERTEGGMTFHYHVAGYMQPIVLFMNREAASTNDALKSTSLADLGIGPSSGRVLLKVRFTYTPPEVDPSDMANIQATFAQKFSALSQAEETKTAEAADPKRVSIEKCLQDALMGKDRPKSSSASSSRSAASQSRPAGSALSSASPAAIPEVVLPPNRGQRVFRAAQSGRLDTRIFDALPDVFFEATNEDFEVHLQMIREKLRRAPVRRRTSSAAFGLTTIRVRLPESIFLEAKFKASEKISTLYEFVHSCLAGNISSSDITLFVTPPRTVLSSEKTFAELGLVPAAIVNFSASDLPEQVLRREVLHTIVDLPSPAALAAPSASPTAESKESSDLGDTSSPAAPMDTSSDEKSNMENTEDASNSDEKKDSHTEGASSAPTPVTAMEDEQ